MATLCSANAQNLRKILILSSAYLFLVRKKPEKILQMKVKTDANCITQNLALSSGVYKPTLPPRVDPAPASCIKFPTTAQDVNTCSSFPRFVLKKASLDLSASLCVRRPRR